METFAALRKHIQSRHNVSSFEDAYANLERVKSGGNNNLSPVNVLAGYAGAYDTAHYKFVDVFRHPDPCIWISHNRVGSCTWCFRRACCRAFNFTNCSVEELTDAGHVTFLGSHWAISKFGTPNYKAAWRTTAADRAYSIIHKQLESMAPESLARMKRGCLDKVPSLAGTAALSPSASVSPHPR